MAKPRAPMEPTSNSDQDLPLFTYSPMSRRKDPSTSRAAAGRVRSKLSTLQFEVLGAFVAAHEMTAKEAEQLPQFDSCSPSTVRKRCSELHRKGFLEDAQARREGCVVLRVTTRGMEAHKKLQAMASGGA